MRPRRLVLLLAAVLLVGVGLFALLRHGGSSRIVLRIPAGAPAGEAAATPEPAAPGDTAIRFAAGLRDGSHFVHPGIFLDGNELAFVHRQIAAGRGPYLTALGAIPDVLADTTYAPSPPSNLDCTSNDAACAAILDDAKRAYTHALLYEFGAAEHRVAHARAAIRILNGYAAELSGYAGTVAQLQLALAADYFSRAAELIRWTFTPASGAARLDVAGLIAMFRTVFLPAFDPASAATTSSNGNWALAMADATIDIGVFSDDEAVFDAGLSLWRARVPAYIYLATDGATPVVPPGGRYDDAATLACYWYGEGSARNCAIPPGFGYVSGMTQETCRDLGHVVMGLAAATYAAETARIQGVDLYGEEGARIRAGWEFNAQYLNDYLTTHRWPTTPCGGPPTGPDPSGSRAAQVSWELAYREFHDRLGLPMPRTGRMIDRFRPTGAADISAWETLTSANTALPRGCTEPDSRLGSVTYTVHVQPGTFWVWVAAQSLTAAGTLAVQVDDGCPTRLAVPPPGHWVWTGGRADRPLVQVTGGTHTITVTTTSPGLEVSALVLSDDIAFVPVGDGTALP